MGANKKAEVYAIGNCFAMQQEARLQSSAIHSRISLALHSGKTPQRKPMDMLLG